VEDDTRSGTAGFTGRRCGVQTRDDSEGPGCARRLLGLDSGGRLATEKHCERSVRVTIYPTFSDSGVAAVPRAVTVAVDWAWPRAGDVIRT
jgi:hypothetical protein